MADPVATPPSRRQRIGAAFVRGFHAYAGWLVGISWVRFFLLAILLMIAAGVLTAVPPFSWTYTRQVSRPAPRVVIKTPDKPASGDAEAVVVHKTDRKGRDIEITIDRRGIRIGAPAAGASAPAPAASAAEERPTVDIRVHGDNDNPTVREAVSEARRQIEDAVREARDDAREAAQADGDTAAAVRNAVQEAIGPQTVERQVSLGEFLPSLAFFWIVASAIVKITYKRQIQAEAQAAQAVETAEAESLKRQVVEARMAAMQAQVEPHFLFNTLASIDHLIETDPARASTMQKNLIALLRASMPTLREAGDGGPRDLKRELEVIRPYLAILKVRMEDRLRTEIDVPEGLQSAEFPAMMIQTLVENAIKHGLEPKADGGHLLVKAEIVHGKLQVTVADTGLGFGRAATAGTGVGLANIRERLQLLYGAKATLAVAENQPSGTRVTVTLPYRTVEEAVTA